MHRSARRGGRRVRVAARGDFRCRLSRASAAAPWIYRGLTLPASRRRRSTSAWATVTSRRRARTIDGFGLNLELRAGVAHNFELGFRMGFRLDDGGQNTQADEYGRPFDTETYGTQLRSRREPGAEASAGRWRAAMPRSWASSCASTCRSRPSRASDSCSACRSRCAPGRSASTPGSTSRSCSTIRHQTIVSVPLHIWIQAASRLLAGPDARHARREPGRSHTAYPLGFGLGWQLSRTVESATWFLFPDISRDAAARGDGCGWFGIALASPLRVASPAQIEHAGRRASRAALGIAPRI